MMNEIEYRRLSNSVTVVQCQYDQIHDGGISSYEQIEHDFYNRNTTNSKPHTMRVEAVEIPYRKR